MMWLHERPELISPPIDFFSTTPGFLPKSTLIPKQIPHVLQSAPTPKPKLHPTKNLNPYNFCTHDLNN